MIHERLACLREAGQVLYDVCSFISFVFGVDIGLTLATGRNINAASRTA